MSSELILIQSAVILGLALVLAAMSTRARASIRHLILAAAFIAVLLLPVMSRLSIRPAIGIPVHLSIQNAAPAIAQAPYPAPAPAAPASSVFPWGTALRAAWFSGLALFLARVVVDLLRLYRLRRDALPCPELSSNEIEILLHENVSAPLTFGVLRPSILLPLSARQWSQADVRHALVHEMEHIRRRDWPLLLLVQAVCALYWFNPLVWMARRRLCLEAELACDDAVLRDHEPAGYARQLVALAEEMSHARARLALGMAKRSDLSIRVNALLDSGRRRGGAGIRATLAAVAVTMFVLLGFGPIRAVAQSDPRAGTPPLPADSALLEAAEKGDIPAVTSLLNSGAQINAAISGDGSPLIAAARAGQLPAVRLLLDRGADPNMAVRGDGCPLIAGAERGHAEIVLLLLDRGAWIDQMVPGDENALIQASRSGHLNVVKLLVARGANPNARAWAEGGLNRPGEWRTPLSMALREKHDDVAAFLRSSGAHD
jgi:beta-lactamase regulating signal transducer with metallopeptidase domain